MVSDPVRSTGRLEAASDIGDMLRAIFRGQKNAFKINLAFGFILSNVETSERRYYYPSQNGLIFDHPLVVADEADLQKVERFPVLETPPFRDSPC